MTATQDHLTTALDHVQQDSQALEHVDTALNELGYAEQKVEADRIGHDHHGRYVGAVRQLTEIVRERLNSRILEEASRAAFLLARDVVEMVRANEHNSVQWITGNHYMPALRSFSQAERVWQEGTEDAWDAFTERFFEVLDDAKIYCASPEYDNALYAVDLRVWEPVPEDEREEDGDGSLADEWRRPLPEGCTGSLLGMTISHDAGTCPVHEDPIATNQSKHVDAEGALRYDADETEVFPGSTGVRKPANDESIGKLGEWKNDA